MTERTFRIRKYILFYLKICTFWKNGDFVKNILEKKSCDFDIFDGCFGCATKFHAEEISFFSFYLCYIKRYSVFCQKFAKVEDTICDCN